MKRLSLFKRLSLYRLYKRVIRANSSELDQRFGLRKDRANRLYTVLNIPSENVGEAYNIKKSDIDKIAEGYIKEFSVEVAKYLDSKGLKEIYDLYEVKKVDKYSYLVVIGPHKDRVLDSSLYNKRIYYRAIPISIIVLIVISLILFL